MKWKISDYPIIFHHFSSMKQQKKQKNHDGKKCTKTQSRVSIAIIKWGF
jgi:hypothetical protein